jgi:dTDP-glucose 4,6-dehydratase
MNLLVTGGCGFIGSNFIRLILGKYPNYKIVNLDKLTYAGNLENLKDVESNENYEFVKGDICDAEIVEKVMKGVDAIVHFAAESFVDRSIADANPFIQTNFYGTYVLLEAARKHNVKKFVYISTDEVYGSIEKGSFKETDQLEPSSPYSASKAASDLLVYSYFVTHKLPVVICRSSNNFGPYQNPEKVIPLFITNAMEDIQLPLYGDGLNVRDWIFVEDNCEAVDFVLQKGKLGEIYNIGGNSERTNIEITKLVLELLGKPESLIKYVTDRLGHDRRYALDITKISELGWKPRFSFKEGMEKTMKTGGRSLKAENGRFCFMETIVLH